MICVYGEIRRDAGKIGKKSEIPAHPQGDGNISLPANGPGHYACLGIVAVQGKIQGFVLIVAFDLIDDDKVCLTNLNRQLVALHSTLGMRKTDVMASRILDINPACRVTNLPVFYEPECREDFFSRGFDYIADCIDSTRSKLDLIETAIRRGAPIISSMGTGNRLDPSKLRITDLSKTSGCPLV